MPITIVPVHNEDNLSNW